MTVVAEGLEWARIYWLKGSTPKYTQYRNAVTDPPCSGWMGALIIRGEKRSTIFCPFTFEAFTVPNDAGEIRGSLSDPRFSVTWLAKFLPKKWAELQTLGFQKDYNTATLIFKKLGLPVPEQILKGGEEDTRSKGGKETQAALLKPVKLSSKRGKFLAWFLEEGTRSIREAMAEFGMSRSNALSYLYMIQKDHGIGYELTGDNATVTLPEGCSNPFDDETWKGPLD